MNVTDLNKTVHVEKPDRKKGQKLSKAGNPDRKSDKAMREDAELKKACADFEGVLLNFMFQSMKKTLPGKGVFGGSHQQEVYDAMFFQEVSTKLARERGLGIGDALYRQLKGTVDGSGSE